MLTLSELQTAVGNWSFANFGHNPTRLLQAFKVSEGGMVNECCEVVYLGSLCSLMGLVEEAGEFASSQSEADIKDALGDMVIYLCDYAEREGISLFEIERHNIWITTGESARIAAAVGRLYHCHLKRFQGIRGMDNDQKFRVARWEAVWMLWYVLRASAFLLTGFTDGIMKDEKGGLLLIANEIWEKVISKRDWKKSPSDGGGFAHNSFNVHSPDAPTRTGDAAAFAEQYKNMIGKDLRDAKPNS